MEVDVKRLIYTSAVLALLAGCGVSANDPRTQLERNLDIPVELAGQIHPARLAYLKDVMESDDIYTQGEQQKIRELVLSGRGGFLIPLNR